RRAIVHDYSETTPTLASLAAPKGGAVSGLGRPGATDHREGRSMKNAKPLIALMRAGLVMLILSCCSSIPLGSSCGAGAGHILDEARCVGRTAESLPGADEDYFRDMDYGATKNPAQVAAALAPYMPGITAEQAVAATVQGRNNWIVWSGGNDRLWDNLSIQSAGILDFLKIISNHPSIKRSEER